MKFINQYKFSTLVLLVLFSVANAFGQASQPAAPREEKLLNGLKLLVWNQPNAAKVTVRIRIHSGSAFDPQGKEGTMRALSDILFPNDSIREFFRDDLGGSLEVASNYDYIQINATGDADKFLTIHETISSALTNPQINKEATPPIVAALAAKVVELEKDPAYAADQAAAKRLFGTFPYGRPQMGSTASLAKIDFADLLLAKQRFLTADNATMTINGGVKPDFALRAVKRLFGGWIKSDRKVPSTFAQPEAPAKELQIIEAAGDKTSELRFAMRGIARGDANYYAAQTLEIVLANRVKAREGATAFARHQTNFLPGSVVLGVSTWKVGTVKKEGDKVALPVDIETYQNNYLQEAVKQEEFDRAKAEIAARLARRPAEELWLDADTYKLASAKDDWQKSQSVTLADVQKMLEKLQKEPVAAVLLVSSAKEGETSTVQNQ